MDTDDSTYVMVLDGPGRTQFLLNDALIDDPVIGARTDSCKPPLMAERNTQPKPLRRPADPLTRETFDDGWAPTRLIDPYAEKQKLPRQTVGSIFADELRTHDGYRFCCFHDKYPHPNPDRDPDGRGPGYLKYWMDRAEEIAPLHAIVVPGVTGPLAYEHIGAWLEWVKEWRPDIKILLVCENVQEAIDNGYPIHKSGHGMQGPIDCVAEHSPWPKPEHSVPTPSNALREMVGTPALPGPDPDHNQKLNIEKYRETRLNQRRSEEELGRLGIALPGHKGYIPPEKGDDEGNTGGSRSLNKPMKGR